MNHSPLNIAKQKKQASATYKPKKDKSYNYIVFAVLCFFIGFGLAIAFYSYVLIDIVTLSKFIAAFAVVGFLIPLKLYRKWFDFIKYEMIIFNIIGIAPILTGLFLCLNFMFTSNEFTHDYKIINIFIDGKENHKTIGVVLENNVFSGNDKIVKINSITPDILNSSHYRVTLAEGLFGFEVVKETKFIKKTEAVLQ